MRFTASPRRFRKALTMQSKRVLCVEDDADTRDMLKIKLDLSDFEAVVAPDIEAA